MGKYDAAKAAAKARASGKGDEDLYEGAPGIYVVLRNLRGADGAPTLRGAWESPAQALAVTDIRHGGTRIFDRALQLYDRTWLYVEAQC